MFNNVPTFPPYGWQPPIQRQPMPMQVQPMQSAPQFQSMPTVAFVQGEEAAKAYYVAPGNTVYIFDLEHPVYHVKSVDASGIPQPLQSFDYTPHDTVKPQPIPDMQNYVTLETFQALAERVSALEPKPKEKEVKNAKSE